jgi:hypothetical protein
MSGQNDIARLAFWARNMTAVSDAGMKKWPGFAYTDAELVRMRVLAQTVTPAAFGKFVVWTTVVFLAVAAAGIVGVFGPLLIVLFPDPAQMAAWKFASLLAACAFLILTLGLALSMSLAARWSADDAMRKELHATAEDAVLGAKVRWQINRIALLMCGALVPGILIWVAYDIRAGALITTLKWIAVGLVLLSTASVVVGNRR